MAIENRNRNLYKQMYSDISGIKKSLSDVEHEGKMGSIAVANTQARTKTIEQVVQGLALGKNIIESQKRMSEDLEEADIYASEAGHEKKSSFSFLDGKKDFYIDKDTGDEVSIGQMLARKTEKDELKRKGLDKPMELPDENNLFDDAMLQFHAREKLDEKLSKTKMSASEGYAKFGDKYSFKNTDDMFKYHKYDFVSMYRDFDSIFGENEVVDNVVNTIDNSLFKPNSTNDLIEEDEEMRRIMMYEGY